MGKLVIGVMGSADPPPAGPWLNEPERLITRLVTYYREEHYLHPNCFVDGASPARGALRKDKPWTPRSPSTPSSLTPTP